MTCLTPITMSTMRNDHLIQALQGVDQTPTETETELIARLCDAMDLIAELREMLKQKPKTKRVQVNEQRRNKTETRAAQNRPTDA